MLTQLRAGDDVAEQLMRLAMARARSGDMTGARRDTQLAMEKAEERRSPMMVSFARFGFGELHQFSVDSKGNVYAADNVLGRPQKLTPKAGANPARLIGQSVPLMPKMR